MARIKVYAKKEPIVIDRDRAERIKKAWMSAREKDPQMLERIIEIDDWSGPMKSIQYVDLTNEVGVDSDQIKSKDKKQYDQYISDMNREHEEYKRGEIALSPEIRAKKFHKFALFWQVLTRQRHADYDMEITINEKKIQLGDAVEKAQLWYFQNNPDKALCSLIAYKKIVESPEVQKLFPARMNKFEEAMLKKFELLEW